MTAAAPSEIEQKMVTALESAGLFPPGATARPLRAITGGEVETFVFAGLSGTQATIWVQRIVDSSAWASASRRAAAVRNAWRAQQDHAVRSVFPDEIGPGLFACMIPEKAGIMVDPVLRAVYGGATEGADLSWLAPQAGKVGSWLRTCQDLAAEDHHGTSAAALPTSNAVIDTVADLLAGSPGGPPPMMRLARAIHVRPRLVRALQDAVRSSRSPAASRLPLHGRLGPAAVLLAPRSGTAYLTGWIDTTHGPGLFDAGYFVGELAECAATARLTGRSGIARQLCDAIRAFGAGYVAERPLAGIRFPAAVADLAGLKVVEHVARYTRHAGDPGPPANHLLTVAESLIDPRGWLTDLLANPAPPNR